MGQSTTDESSSLFVLLLDVNLIIILIRKIYIYANDRFVKLLI